jgi:hypothetical protein
MQTFEVRLALRDEIAQRAESEGLLSPDALQDMIEAELRRRSAKRLLASVERLSATDPAEKRTQEEVEAEIAAYRAEKRAARASRG